MYTLKDIRRKEAAQDIEEFISGNLISKIRAYRVFFGVSQRELSRRSGVTQNIISRMENGLATPQLPTLMKLLNALELDIEINVTPREKDEVGILETLDQEKLRDMRNKTDQLREEKELLSIDEVNFQKC